MKSKSIPSAWLLRDGRRLDCGPYMSGALEARVKLETLKVPKVALADVTEGGIAGIFNGPRFARTYVSDPDFGVPFLGSTDILNADLSGLSLLSRKQVNAARRLVIRSGWTLITCSGTIGRMAFSRPDMDGLAGSQHFMRVVPDKDKIPPGFLYAYLSGRFGVPLVVGGTYGAIIQHIEPHHIAQLPVPRLGGRLEEKADELVTTAAEARSRAAGLKKAAVVTLNSALGLSDLSRSDTSTSVATFSVPSVDLGRLDAAHFSPVCIAARDELAESGSEQIALREVAEVFTPGIFKRIHVEDPSFGYPYFSGSELFQHDPSPRGYLSKKAPNITNYIVRKDWLLMQDAGQLGGLIGRLVRVSPDIADGVVSNHLMRIVPKSASDGAYLFSVLSSPHGYRSITRHAFGTSIPQLDPKHIREIVLPWPAKEARESVAQLVLEAWRLEDSSTEAEREAVALVENAIEEAA